jgi:hypothetical protein
MCTLDSKDRVQSSNTVFTSIACHSKVPETDSTVPSSGTQKFSVLRVPGDAFYCACVTLQSMGNGVGSGTNYTRGLIARASSQEGVVRIPFDVKDSVVVRLQDCTGRLYYFY